MRERFFRKSFPHFWVRIVKNSRSPQQHLLEFLRAKRTEISILVLVLRRADAELIKTAGVRTVPEGIFESEANKNSFHEYGTGRTDAELIKTAEARSSTCWNF